MTKLRVAASMFLLMSPALLWGQMPEMGAPSEMKEVSYMVGTWKGDFHYKVDPAAADWMTSEMTMVVEPILNGSAQRSHMHGKMMGMDFSGIATLSYNRQTGKWQQIWIDNINAYQVVTEGKLHGEKLVFLGKDVFAGQSYLMRDTTKKVSAGEIDWQMEMSFDEGKTWAVAMKAKYRKQ